MKRTPTLFAMKKTHSVFNGSTALKAVDSKLNAASTQS